MPTTYEPIATTTLGSAASSITFSSIPSTYTDLRIIINCISVGNSTGWVRCNGDSGTNYSLTHINGNGATATSGRSTSTSNGLGIQTSVATGTTPVLWTFDLFSYASTSIYKTALTTASNDQNGAGSVQRTVAMWQNTSAVTSLEVRTSIDNFNTGTTATLYGILKA
jgi:hypothetical protein